MTLQLVCLLLLFSGVLLLQPGHCLWKKVYKGVPAALSNLCGPSPILIKNMFLPNHCSLANAVFDDSVYNSLCHVELCHIKTILGPSIQTYSQIPLSDSIQMEKRGAKYVYMQDRGLMDYCLSSDSKVSDVEYISNNPMEDDGEEEELEEENKESEDKEDESEDKELDEPSSSEEEDMDSEAKVKAALITCPRTNITFHHQITSSVECGVINKYIFPYYLQAMLEGEVTVKEFWGLVGPLWDCLFPFRDSNVPTGSTLAQQHQTQNTPGMDGVMSTSKVKMLNWQCMLMYKKQVVHRDYHEIVMMIARKELPLMPNKV
ncbi:hypothetical protein FA15DRAFT_660662 [Coprinopsis marcescibilis]|uniref:Uncharacterized protein n=1 Tax=Coprinopsis marcescibilis TaxID=230819 RepID=A0A5C3KF74_COPMA|nr:hypothetical protein FA15DRAFT_660662 [Coprinopsis marcescibilis]